MTFPRLFSVDNPKAAKASGYGWLNAIHYMAPYTMAGVGNLCPNASPQCVALCLGHYSGQAGMVSNQETDTNPTRESRKSKAQLFMTSRADYMNRMARDIVKLERKAAREGLRLCVRLNGSTDIVFERIRFVLDASTLTALGLSDSPSMTLLQCFPHVQFVEYTKSPNRLGKSPSNLDLTLSYSGNNARACVQALLEGHNVAMVFHGALPESFGGFPVINGDLHDLRHLDVKGGFIVGLTPKGRKAKRDESGFVVRHGLPQGAGLESTFRIERHAMTESKAA